jgi:glucose 1-dehydrogenase
MFILYNFQRDSAFQVMTLEKWNFVPGVNLTGHFICSGEAIREFLRRRVDPSKSIAAGKSSRCWR